MDGAANSTPVTLARIDGKLDNILSRLDAVCSQVSDHEQRVRVTERLSVISERNWQEHRGQHDDEWRSHRETHNTERGITGGVGGLVTALLAYLQLSGE